MVQPNPASDYLSAKNNANFQQGKSMMNEAIHKAKEQQKHDWQTGKAAMNEAIRHAKFESKHNKDAAV